MHPSANGTGLAVAVGAFLAFIAGSFGIGGLAVIRSIGESWTVPRLVGRVLGVVILLAVAAACAFGASCLFWTAHRGDYAPWANARIECRTQASQLGLLGSEKSSYVSRCVQAAVDYDAE